jgi:aryl-alcohol dehydrogenase-like predicted oxidoreductase
MEYRFLGRSGIKVSTVGLGAMTFGTNDVVGRLSIEEARAVCDQALDAGVNLIDTANVYSFGVSEEIVGQVIQGRRDRVILATKVRFAMDERPNSLGLSRHHIIESCEASLRRLNVDHIDLYQLHGWDGKTPLEETLGALETLIQQGKIRYVGCSNYSAWHLMKALGTADRLQLPRFVSQQIYYSLLGREVEYELIPASVDQGLGVLVWSPLASGLLTGKHRRGAAAPEGTRHATPGWREPPIEDWDAVHDVIDRLVEVANRVGAPPAQVALAYLIGKPGVTSVIIGGRTPEQLVSNIEAASLQLWKDDIADLDRVSQPPTIYPYWHQAMNIMDRLSPADETLVANNILPADHLLEAAEAGQS